MLNKNNDNYHRVSDYFILLTTVKRALLLIILPAVVISIIMLAFNIKYFMAGSEIYNYTGQLLDSVGKLVLDQVKMFFALVFAIGMLWLLIDFTQALVRSIIHEGRKERIFSLILLAVLIIRALFQIFH